MATASGRSALFGSPPCTPPSRFAIGFDHRDRERLHALWDQALDNERWSEGELVLEFERAWEAWNGLPAVAYSSWSGAALAALQFVGVTGETVLCPSNTFMATPLAVARARAGTSSSSTATATTSACRSRISSARRSSTSRAPRLPRAHRRAPRVRRREDRGVLPRRRHLPDRGLRPRAHGAAWNGRRAGTWGDAGIWSFAATKTISTGEGGMLVSRHPELVEFARAFRNYGKPDHTVRGLNYRMNEFTAALGIVKAERLDEIAAWKNDAARESLDPVYPARVQLPDGMVSGLYKYIVFEPIERSTGKVYDAPCHRLMGARSTCRTPTGSRRTTGACRSTTGHPRTRTREGPRHRRLRVHRLARRRPPAGAAATSRGSSTYSRPRTARSRPRSAT